MLLFFTRLNLVAWFRFVTLVLKEVFLRLGIAADIDLYVESFKLINEALNKYLNELESIDIELFLAETKKYNELLSTMDEIKTETELNTYLLQIYDTFNINKPWKGDFDEFMSNKGNRLVFK